MMIEEEFDAATFLWLIFCAKKYEGKKRATKALFENAFSSPGKP